MINESPSAASSANVADAEMPAELALVARILDRLGARVRSIGGSVRWVVDGSAWHLDLEVDGGRWRPGANTSADTNVTATTNGISALFKSAEELERVRRAGELRAVGDLERLAAIGAALTEGGSFLTHLSRRKAR